MDQFTPAHTLCGAAHPTEDATCTEAPGPNARRDSVPVLDENQQITEWLPGREVHVHRGYGAGGVHRWEDEDASR